MHVAGAGQLELPGLIEGASLWWCTSALLLSMLHAHVGTGATLKCPVPPCLGPCAQVWDVRNHKCIQTINDKEVYSPDDTLLCMCYDQKRKTLLTGVYAGVCVCVCV